MTSPTDRNRLEAEAGPYLRQFVDDPVNWQPWDERALGAARSHDVPIFLSIGRMTSPRCRRMRTESFRDEAVATLLNEHFVPVAVDRTARPDLDSIYQTVCRVVDGTDGWPLSVWLTPDQEPFYVGTYFPPENEDWAPGFGEMLELVAEKWSSPDVREAIDERGTEWTAAAREELEAVPQVDDHALPPGEEAVERIADTAVRTADRKRGGWGTDGKFPEPSRIRLLLSVGDVAGNGDRARVATAALDGIASGAVHDQIGGGFFRGAASRDWTDPQEGKYLDSNADIVRAFLAGYAATGNEQYAAVARRTLSFVQRDLGEATGGFGLEIAGTDWPADDAANRGERAYYEWTPGEVASALGDERDAALACDRYGIGQDESATASTPRLAASIADLAAERDESESSLSRRLDRIRETLLEARTDRASPPRDERSVVGPTGLAIWAFADAGVVLDGAYALRAEEAVSFVRERFWSGGRLAGRYVEGEGPPRGDAFLEDYAFLGRGAFACYGATGSLEALAFGLDISNALVERFYREDDGRLHPRPGRTDTPLVTPQETRDWDAPSPIAVATELLSVADRFVPDGRYGDAAARILDEYEQRIPADLLRHHTLALAGYRHRSGWTEVTTAAEGLPDRWHSLAAEQSPYGALLAPRPSSEEGLAEWLEYLELGEVPPVWDGREAGEDLAMHESPGDDRDTTGL